MIDDANGFQKNEPAARVRQAVEQSARGPLSLLLGRPRLPNFSQAEGCAMDGPTLAFFGIGLAIVAVFVILMLRDD